METRIEDFSIILFGSSTPNSHFYYSGSIAKSSPSSSLKFTKHDFSISIKADNIFLVFLLKEVRFPYFHSWSKVSKLRLKHFLNFISARNHRYNYSNLFFSLL